MTIISMRRFVSHAEFAAALAGRLQGAISGPAAADYERQLAHMLNSGVRISLGLLGLGAVGAAHVKVRSGSG